MFEGCSGLKEIPGYIRIKLRNYLKIGLKRKKFCLGKKIAGCKIV